MQDTGSYSRAFTWMKYTPSTKDAYNQKPPAWTANGTLWGELKEESGDKSQEYNVIEAETKGTLTLRQFPTVSALDRLVDHQFGLTWIIDGVTRVFSKNETTLAVHLFEQQAGT